MFMKNPNTINYNKSYTNFKNAVNSFISKINNKLNSLTTTTKTFSKDSETITLADNQVFQYVGTKGISELIIKYPNEDFISTVIFSTANSGKIKVKFPSGTTFVGHKKLEFFNQETWELNIHNGRVAASQIFEN